MRSAMKVSFVLLGMTGITLTLAGCVRCHEVECVIRLDDGPGGSAVATYDWVYSTEDSDSLTPTERAEALAGDVQDFLEAWKGASMNDSTKFRILSRHAWLEGDRLVLRMAMQYNRFEDLLEDAELDSTDLGALKFRVGGDSVLSTNGRVIVEDSTRAIRWPAETRVLTYRARIDSDPDPRWSPQASRDFIAVLGAQLRQSGAPPLERKPIVNH